jgi:magnesium-transporting ATPase (P-type)
VRNSGSLFLLVLYTGEDTKLIMNQGKYQYKTSKMDFTVNVLLAIQVAMMFVMNVVMSYLFYRFVMMHSESYQYIF